MPIKVNALDHVVINVADLVASTAWYMRVLGITPHQDASAGPPTTFKFGHQALRLRPIATGKDEWFTADNDAVGSDDLCFLTTASPEEVIAHLGACGVPVERGPVEQRGGRGRLLSVYCRDPDGSLIEIATPQD